MVLLPKSVSEVRPGSNTLTKVGWWTKESWTCEFKNVNLIPKVNRQIEINKAYTPLPYIMLSLVALQ